MSKKKTAPPNIQYYDPIKNWRKIKRHLSNAALNDILVNDFNKYTYGRWGQAFKHGELPSKYESADWRLHTGRPPSREPSFWAYVKHGASHWLVNFNLKLAQLVEPTREWRIVTGEHSTVWDGHDTLFDFNFLALGISQKEAFELAFKKGRELKPGALVRTNFAAFVEFTSLAAVR